MIAGLVVRLRYLIVAAWIAAAVAATLLLPPLGSGQDGSLGGLVPKDAEPLAVERRALDAFGFPLLTRLAIVQHDAAGLSPRVVENAFRRALDPPAGVALALPIVNDRRLMPLAGEHDTSVVTFLFPQLPSTIAEHHAAAEAYIADAGTGDAVVGITGPGPARLAEWRAISQAMPIVEGATVAMIAVVLGLSFRAPGAALVVLLTAALAFLVSARVAAWAGSELGVPVPREIEPIMVALLLGLVTDYAVFQLSGVRRLLAGGEAAVAAARRTASSTQAILAVAASVVVLGALALLLGRLDYFRSLGPGLAISVAVALLAATTFLPALLALLGRRTFWPSLAHVPRAEQTAPASAAQTSRSVAFVVRRRGAIVVTVVGVALLGALAGGLSQTRLGFTLLDGLPRQTQERAAATAAADAFAAGILSPSLVLLEGPSSTDWRKLAALEAALAERPGVAAVVGPALGEPARELFVSRDGTTAQLLVVLDESPHAAPALELARELERDLPALLRGAGLEDVGGALAGDTALASATIDGLLRDLGRIVIAAALANLLLLALFLRSLVAPLFLLAASGLALAATLGLATLVFRYLLGWPDMTYFVPFAASVLLLSLGSDYSLFLVGRIWQAARTRSLEDAIAHAVPRASRAIGVAGVTLAASFALLALVPLRGFREFALVMACGILIDTFLVRPLLVPALVSLFGEASWWPRASRNLRASIRAAARARVARSRRSDPRRSSRGY